MKKNIHAQSKLLLASGFVGIILLSGCQQIQEQAQALRKQGDQAVTGFSQQAIDVQTKVLETKAKYDEKSQQVVNAVDSVNKLMK